MRKTKFKITNDYNTKRKITIIFLSILLFILIALIAYELLKPYIEQYRQLHEFPIGDFEFRGFYAANSFLSKINFTI